MALGKVAKTERKTHVEEQTLREHWDTANHPAQLSVPAT